MGPATQVRKRGLVSTLRLASCCGVGGVLFMLATSLLGIVVSPHWPERWVRIRVFPAFEFDNQTRMWHIQSFNRLGWSDVMGSRSSTETPADERAIRVLHAEPDLSGSVSRRLRRGDPLPVVRADGEVWWREYASGWPWRAWRGGDSLVPAPGGHTVRSESTVTFRDPLGWNRFGYLVPYGPVWSGIVLNSLVGAIGIWALVVFPAAVRRARRRKRGCCVACGYDLAGVGGGVCPECGGGQTALGARVGHG
jgi:hypothetical protein